MRRVYVSLCVYMPRTYLGEVLFGEANGSAKVSIKTFIIGSGS